MFLLAFSLVIEAVASISYNDLFIIDCTVNLKMVATGEVKEKFQCADIDIFQHNVHQLSFGWNNCPLDSTSPPNACTPVTLSPANVSRVALVPTNLCQGQEDCELMTKAKSLSGGPYVAFITWRESKCSSGSGGGGDGGGDFGDNSTEPSLIAVVLDKSKAVQLKPYTNNSRYVVDISISLWRFGDLLLTFMGVFLGTTACMCACFCCFFGVRVYVNRPRTTTLSNRELNRATRRIKYRKRQGSDDTCSICLEEFSEREVVRELPCRHLYHNQCVDTWLRKYNALCPNCKTPIKSTKPTPEEQPLLSGDPESVGYGSTRAHSPLVSDEETSVVLNPLEGDRHRVSDSDNEPDLPTTSASLV